jgi:hypothetical protein
MCVVHMNLLLLAAVENRRSAAMQILIQRHLTAVIDTTVLVGG